MWTLDNQMVKITQIAQIEGRKSKKNIFLWIKAEMTSIKRHQSNNLTRSNTCHLKLSDLLISKFPVGNNTFSNREISLIILVWPHIWQTFLKIVPSVEVKANEMREPYLALRKSSACATKALKQFHSSSKIRKNYLHIFFCRFLLAVTKYHFK